MEIIKKTKEWLVAFFRVAGLLGFIHLAFLAASIGWHTGQDIKPARIITHQFTTIMRE